MVKENTKDRAITKNTKPMEKRFKEASAGSSGSDL
jgi:hypothetical protein